jgi:hypothetical protein
LGKSSAETVVMQQTAYKEAAMSKTQIYEFVKSFWKIAGGRLTNSWSLLGSHGVPVSEF